MHCLNNYTYDKLTWNTLCHTGLEYLKQPDWFKSYSDIGVGWVELNMVGSASNTNYSIQTLHFYMIIFFSVFPSLESPGCSLDSTGSLLMALHHTLGVDNFFVPKTKIVCTFLFTVYCLQFTQQVCIVLQYDGWKFAQ